jgi:lipoate-protein ligase B
MARETARQPNTDRRCLFADLGVAPVEAVERIMSTAASLRAAGKMPDLLFFLAHPPTVALGCRDREAGQPQDLLVPMKRLEQEGITLTRSIRGGGITYHWPGQVVCYPVLLLDSVERNIAAYMSNLEEVGIRTLRQFGVEVDRRRESAAHLGLWCDGRKVASMGVRISRWVTSFGFAINLEGDHGPSKNIRPCGLDGVHLVTLEEILGRAPARTWIVESLKESFAAVFTRTIERMPQCLLENLGAQAPDTRTRGAISGWLT